MDAPSHGLAERLRRVSMPARKLFCVIVRQAFHGPMHPKANGTSVPAEVLEACGLDVGEFYGLVSELARGGLIQLSGAYPFEEISLTQESAPAQDIAERCRKENVPLEHVLAMPDSGQGGD